MVSAMRLINQPKIENFKKKHPDCRSALDVWRLEVEEAKWDSFHTVQQRYSTASNVNKYVIFNIKGKKYRLVVQINYEVKIVFIVWIGTHSAYSKIDWKNKH